MWTPLGRSPRNRQLRCKGGSTERSSGIGGLERSKTPQPWPWPLNCANPQKTFDSIHAVDQSSVVFGRQWERHGNQHLAQQRVTKVRTNELLTPKLRGGRTLAGRLEWEMRGLTRMAWDDFLSSRVSRETGGPSIPRTGAVSVAVSRMNHQQLRFTPCPYKGRRPAATGEASGSLIDIVNIGRERISHSWHQD